MSVESLIPESIMDQLGEGEEAFREVVIAARSSLKRVLASSALQGSLAPIEWRRQFVHEVYGAAAGLNVPLDDTVATVLQSESSLDSFDAYLTRKLTAIRFAHRIPARIDSVALSPISKETLRADLERLRDRVNASNLSDALKAILHERIDAVEGELDKARSRMSTVWLLTGALTLFSGGTAVLADAGDAIENVRAGVASITATFVAEKDAEQREDDRRAGRSLLVAAEPVKQLTDQSGADERSR